MTEANLCPECKTPTTNLTSYVVVAYFMWFNVALFIGAYILKYTVFEANLLASMIVDIVPILCFVFTLLKLSIVMRVQYCSTCFKASANAKKKN